VAVEWGGTQCPGDVGDYIQSGRDFYVDSGVKPGYVSYPYPHPLQGVYKSGTPVYKKPNYPANLIIER
jgi:hypothetical protein